MTQNMPIEIEENCFTRAIIDNAPFGIHMYELKPDGRLIFTGANPTANQILGIDHQQFVGKTIEEAFPPLIATVIPETYRRVAANRETYKQDQVNYQDGQISGAFEIHAFQTSPNRMAVFFTDITERMRAAEELDKYHKRLEELVFERTSELEAATQELESFAYSISHDLRSPLRHIDSYSRLLEQDMPGELPEDAADDIKHIRESIHRMGELIDGLLEYSRLNRQQVKRQHLELREVVDTVLAELVAKQGEREIQITIGELPACEADATLTKQVFSNLIGNALKYSQKSHPARIDIGSEPVGQQVACFIRDNGVGFDMAAADKLFGVFQRLHPDHEYAGIGMGLAITQRIIHRHGGRIWAQSQPGQGATFYFTLSK